jgi:hypothetical protein
MINIREALYQFNYDKYTLFNDYTIKELFNSPDVVDYRIDIRDIVHIEQEWMRHHHNRLWCYFGWHTTEEERIDMRMNGLPIEEHHRCWPMFRVNVNVFRKALIYEIDNIPYETFLQFKIKYVHVKIRTRGIDG